MFTKGLAVTCRDRGGNNETPGSQLHHFFFFISHKHDEVEAAYPACNQSSADQSVIL